MIPGLMGTPAVWGCFFPCRGLGRVCAGSDKVGAARSDLFTKEGETHASPLLLHRFLSLPQLQVRIIADVSLALSVYRVVAGSSSPGGGEGDGDDLACVGARANGGHVLAVRWSSEPGERYRVLVHGGSTRAFRYIVQVTAAGDSCGSPLGPFTADLGTLGSVAVHTSSNIASQALWDLDVCGRRLAGDRGVFYDFVGTGGTMIATTCHPSTDFDTQLLVFLGEYSNCGGLNRDRGEAAPMTCLGWNDNSTTAVPTNDVGCSTVSWMSEANVVYKVLVVGATEDDVGYFGLRVTMGV